MSWHVDGYAEAGIGTANPDPWLHFFLELGQWRLLWEGPASPQPLWPGDAPRPRHEWLLAHPGSRSGQVRLFQFDDAAPAPRAGLRTWDTGGIFDLDLRVRAIDEWAELLTERYGWRGFSDPITWPFGELQVREWLAEGPDGVVVAFVERVHPPLESGAVGAGFSHAFNSSQTVRDVDRSLAVFEALGFGVRVRQRQPLGGRGGEMLGLAPDVAGSTEVDLAIAHPTGDLEGSVELVALPGTPGTVLPAPSGPGIRGLNLLRFPARGLEALAQHLEARNVTVHSMARWPLPPHGTVRGLALTTPDGAWLECFEPETDTNATAPNATVTKTSSTVVKPGD